MKQIKLRNRNIEILCETMYLDKYAAFVRFDVNEWKRKYKPKFVFGILYSKLNIDAIQNNDYSNCGLIECLTPKLKPKLQSSAFKDYMKILTNTKLEFLK